MADHKKLNRPDRRAASIDGFVSGGRELGIPSHRAYQPNRNRPTPSLDSFIRRSDGFHAQHRSSNTMGDSPESIETAALLDKPILLDTEPETKKRRHYFVHKRPRLRRVLKRASMGLGALLIVGGGFLAYKFYIAGGNLFGGGGGAPALAENIDINQLRGEGDGRVNILLLGNGGAGHSGADLTDTIMLVSIDPINNKAALLSVPRDLWVRIPGDGNQKINAAFAYGKQQSKAKDLKGRTSDGLDLVDKTLSPIIGIPIHYHAVVNFNGFKQMVDAVGGVSFNVPETLYDPSIAWENNWNPVIARQGQQDFDGKKALLYAKSRQTSSDFARGERQRQVLVALKEKIFSAGTFSNPLKISQLLSSLGNNVHTDFSLGELKRVQEIMSKMPSSSIVSLDLVKPPHDFLTTGNINGLSVVYPKAGLFEYGGLQNYVRNTLKDGFIAKENSKVAIYNATNIAGLATKKADELKSYGYNVPTITNAPTTNPPTTVIVDLSKGKDRFTRHYLEKRFGVSARGSVPGNAGITPPLDTTFVIILGEDAANSR